MKSNKRNFSNKYSDVRNSILKYSRDSVFTLAMNYLAMENSSGGKSFMIQDAQWLIFMMIKISSSSTGVLKMNDTDFVRLCNKLFRLQDYLIDADPTNLLLRFRPLIYQQSLLRKDVPECMRSLARQCKILGGNEFYEKTFHEITGVGVASYFTIWLNILVQATGKKGSGYFELNIIDLLYRVQKVVPLYQVVNFFVFFGVRYSDLPTFFARFSGSAGTVDDYYYDTPLKKKPFLVSGKKIYLFSEKLLLSCFPLLLIQTIKDARVEDAKAQLGLDVEAYIGGLLKKTALKVFDEKALKTIYRKNNIPSLGSKVTDFAIDGESVVLLESKAIEQTDWLKVNTDPVELKKRLDQDFIKAVIQAEKCAMFLSQTEEFRGRNFKAVVVTYDDFGISTASSIKQLIGVDIEEEVKKQCNGECPISLDDIVFIAVSDFEALTFAIENEMVKLDEIIEECLGEQSFNAGMSFRKAIMDRCEFDIYKQAGDVLTSDDSFIQQLVSFSNSGHALNVQRPQELIVMHDEVMRSINFSFL